MSQLTFNRFTWVLLATAVILPFVAWGQNYGWNLDSLTVYQWFPLFGLLAWMVMWTHYITGTTRILNPGLQKPPKYSGVTAWFVLGAILLHPGLLSYGQWRNDAGLPPDSYYNYVGEGLKLAVVLGLIALIIFLSFEVFDRMKHNATIKKWWPAISISQSLAMILIFVHAVRLGGTVGDGWFQVVWFIAGASLIPCFYLIHKNDFRSS